MNFLWLLCIGLFSALLSLSMNSIALIPWRRAKGQHWSEQARVYNPARVAAISNLWVLPAVTAISFALLFPESGPHWAWVALAASLGVLIGTVPMDREVHPRVDPAQLWRQTTIGWVIRFFMWFVFLSSAALMPDEFNLQALAIFVVVLALLICWNQFGWLKAGQVLGLMSSPPERLVNIARNVAGKMDVSFNELFLMRSSLAQAYALPSRKALLFSSRLLDLLTDEEINSVCAHELAHLTESRGDYYKRYVTWIMFLPWTLVKPVIHTFGDAGFMMLLVTTFVAPIIFRHVSHKLEMRADTIAHTNESNPGAYARALAKIYEDNLVPAVNAKDRATHPHLYDRLLAAGVTPDFPRPRPTSAMSLHGRILALALGALGALLIIRIINDQRSN